MALPAQQLRFFADYIQKELGIVYGEQNFFQLEQRLERVVQALNFADANDLYKTSLQKIDGDLKQLLLDIATNNETSFFRDPKVFKALEEYVLPQLSVDFPKSGGFKIWSAASSFGQEPYSIAMLVHEFLAAHPGHARFEITATDVADHALKRAREARYSQLEIQRGLPANKMVKYFKKLEDDTWELNREIRQLVRFSRLNLMDTLFPISQCHVIFCRYVLIYQDVVKKKEIFTRLVNSLLPRGFLVLGASESAIGLSDQLEQISKDGAIIYQKK